MRSGRHVLVYVIVCGVRWYRGFGEVDECGKCWFFGYFVLSDVVEDGCESCCGV